MRVRRQHSPLLLLCITMILRVRRKIFVFCNVPQQVLLTFGYVHRSSPGSPGACAVNTFQTLRDKENNYLISGNEQKVADMVR